MKKTEHALKVVNDMTDRAIAFMNDYNEDPRTKNENEMQDLLQVLNYFTMYYLKFLNYTLQVAEGHRKRLTSTKRKFLINYTPAAC
jgi:hypothetical protein